MRRPSPLGAVAAAVLLVLAACGGSAASRPAGGDEDERLEIVTTISPITSIVSTIVGDLAHVRGIVPEGTNSHTFEPRPSVAETLATDQALINGDWAAFHARAERAMDRRAGWIVVADADGQQVVNTLRPYGAPLPRIKRTQEETSAFSAGRSKVSDLLAGPVAGKPVITVGTPITVKGKFYVLSYVVDAASFTSVFRKTTGLTPTAYRRSLL